MGDFMENQFKFYLTDDNGNKTEYDVLYTFHSDITGRDYIIYTDGTITDDGSVEMLAGAYNRELPEIVLESIETDSEWGIIEEFINSKIDEPEDEEDE